jgi:predicted transcriptional regulator
VRENIRSEKAGNNQREENAMSTQAIKEAARQLVEQLPEDATWEDLQYQIYFRQAVEAGLKDSREGRTVPLEEARLRFGLGPR